MLVFSAYCLLSLVQIQFPLHHHHRCLSGYLRVSPHLLLFLLCLISVYCIAVCKQHRWTGAVQYKSNICHKHAHVQYPACVLVCLCQHLCLSLLLPPPPHPICDPAWELASHWFFFCFSVQTPGCHGNVAAAPLGASPILDCLRACPEQKVAIKQQRVEIHNDINKFRIAAGSLLSACQAGVPQNIKPTPRIHTLRFCPLYCVCACWSSSQKHFSKSHYTHPQPPPPPNDQRIQSTQLRQLVWKRISKAPIFSFIDSLLSTAVF